MLIYFLIGFFLIKSSQACSGDLDFDCEDESSKCISSLWRCDNLVDCPNGFVFLNSHFLLEYF